MPFITIENIVFVGLIILSVKGAQSQTIATMKTATATTPSCNGNGQAFVTILYGNLSFASYTSETNQNEVIFQTNKLVNLVVSKKFYIHTTCGEVIVTLDSYQYNIQISRVFTI